MGNPEFVSSPGPISPDAMTEANFTRSWRTRGLAVSKGYNTENERVSTRMLQKALSSLLNMASAATLLRGRTPVYVWHTCLHIHIK